MSTIKHMRADHLPPLWLLKAHIFENLSVLGALKPAEFGSPVIKKKLPFVGLSMMCYTFGKAERTCKGERQARGLIGKLLY